MPKSRVYVQVNNRRGRIFIRRYLDNHIVNEFANDPKKLMSATLIAFRRNNSKAADNVSLRIMEHLKRIDKEEIIPADFAPKPEPIITQIVVKN